MYRRLKQLRIELGLKQRELAARLQVPTSSVGAWETGGKPLPALRLVQICKLFNVSREWLESGAGDMFAPAPPEPPAPNDPAPRGKDSAQALQDAAAALFAELSPNGQAAVLNALRDYIRKHSGDNAAGSNWPFSD